MNIACVEVPWIVQIMTVNIARTRIAGVTSQYKSHQLQEWDFLDRQVNQSILHQDNRIEILGKVFQKFRDVLMIAILCGMTLCECVCQVVLNVNRFGVLIKCE